MPRIKKNDHDIKADIARELAWDTRVAPTEIGVQVKNGVVTLAGTVDSWAKVRAAAEAAHRAPGVLDVANDLVVNPPGSAHRSDADIAHAVRHALEWDVTVPDRQIRSTVTGGIVTLEGIVARLEPARRRRTGRRAAHRRQARRERDQDRTRGAREPSPMCAGRWRRRWSDTPHERRHGSISRSAAGERSTPSEPSSRCKRSRRCSARFAARAASARSRII